MEQPSNIITFAVAKAAHLPNGSQTCCTMLACPALRPFHPPRCMLFSRHSPSHHVSLPANPLLLLLLLLLPGYCIPNHPCVRSSGSTCRRHLRACTPPQATLPRYGHTHLPIFSVLCLFASRCSDVNDIVHRTPPQKRDGTLCAVI